MRACRNLQNRPSGMAPTANIRAAVAVGAMMAALIFTAAGTKTAQAQINGDFLGSFQDWSAYIRGEGSDRICFIAATPAEASLRDNRGNIGFIIQQHPGNGGATVVQIEMGYPAKDSTAVNLEIGEAEWALWANDGKAWTYGPTNGKPPADRAIIRAMRGGLTMQVSGTSRRNRNTVDKYSLRGVSRALQAIDEACGG